jgi:hypothetical protein
VVIGVEVLADADVVAVVAEEGGLQVRVRRIAEELRQPGSVEFRDMSVVLVAQGLSPPPFAYQFGVVRIVEFPVEHLLLLGPVLTHGTTHL